MTAEAVVLNKSAVAMAADSAVTISGGRGRHLKTFDTANKLFEMIKGRPVGIMMYSNAELNGVPWETIVKSYRQGHADQSFLTLREYCESFIRYLESPSRLFDEESESHAFSLLAYEMILQISQRWVDELPRCVTSTGRPIKKRVRAVVAHAVDEVQEEISKIEEGDWGFGVADVRASFAPVAVSLVDDIFEHLGLSHALRKRIVGIIIDAATRKIPTNSDSGVVVAGFGSEDPFPSLRSMSIGGRLCGRVRTLDSESVHISQTNPGDVRTFAQDRMAWGLLTGIDSQVRAAVMMFWVDWLDKSREQLQQRIGSAIPRLSKATLQKAANVSWDTVHEAFHEFLEHMQRNEDERFRDPIIGSIPFLPRTELAPFVESLVNITSIWQRVSVQSAQTVGGEIDVALISPGDGFIWIRRKHYFSMDLNPAWPMTHSGTLPVRDSATSS